MKPFVAFLVFVWLICGLSGAWRLDKLDPEHWKDIAKGPFTLAESFSENPVSYPGP